MNKLARCAPSVTGVQQVAGEAAGGWRLARQQVARLASRQVENRANIEPLWNTERRKTTIPTIYGRWHVMSTIYVPNLSEIDQCAAELLTINDRFFVHFRGCSNLSIGDLKNACTDLHQICWKHCHVIANTQFKNCEDILLGLQTTGAQT